MRSNHRKLDGQTARVLVADDHPLFRIGIRDALEGHQFVVCAEAGDADEAVAAAVREQPDICLVDVHMPGGGIPATERITELVPGTAVVIISASSDDATILAALRAGAVGFLLKDGAFGRLPEALMGVLNGEAAVPRETTARLIDALRHRYRSDRSRRLPAGISLTSRETDVLDLLVEGLGTAEIAARLTLARVTVRTHVAALLRKFGAKDRAALLSFFEDPGPAVREDTSV